jgi:broad specificity phosphatase PhoE
VRHGQTESNVLQLFCGHTDIPLDATGMRQAQLLGDRIGQEVSADAILTSPLMRARATAAVIAERLQLDPIVVPGLIEINFGAFEGTTIERLQDEHPELALRMTDPHDLDAAWPEGESRRGFHHRVFSTFEAILADYATRTVISVTHGGVIGSFLAQVQGLSPNDPRAYVMSNCSLTRLEVTARNTTIHLLNDIVHLEVLAAEQDEA